MKKLLVPLIVFLMIAHAAVAQDDESQSYIQSIDVWSLRTDVTKVYGGEEFASDGIGGRGHYLFLSYDDVNWGLFSDDEFFLGWGLTGSYQNNTGNYHDGRYYEKLENWTGGLMSVFGFADSRLNLSASFGQLFGEYTLRSGYIRKTKNNYLELTGEFIYQQGRLNGKDLFPAFRIFFAGNIPLHERSVPLFGYQEMQFRQALNGQNLNSIHGLGELNIYDFRFSGKADDTEIKQDNGLLISPKLRGVFGKYTNDYNNVRYLGFGGGVDVIFQGSTALHFNIDYCWGQWQSKKANLYLGIGVDLNSMPKIVKKLRGSEEE